MVDGSLRIDVYGAGPAGAAASLLLASWGHSVRLISRRSAEHRLAVSLPPSCGKLFDAIGVGQAVARAGFLRSTGNTVWWGSAEPRVEHFAAGQAGWQLEVHALAKVLIDAGVNAGVRTADAPDLSRPPIMTLDCTGRAGLVAKTKGVRAYDGGTRTIALAGEWRRGGAWDIPDQTHTLIESYEAGWMWSVPLANGCRHIAAMIDPQRSQLHRGGSSRDVYLAEIRKTRVFAELVDDATLIGGPSGWDASQYHSTAYAADDWLLVGDAGSFIDPLSSAGVKKALASAWLAAVVAHTCVTTPAMKPHALAFFTNRESEIAAGLMRDSQRFLADAAVNHQHAFWNERGDAPITADDEVAVKRAFEGLKARPHLQAKSGDLRIDARPCVRGHAIVLEPHVVTTDEPNGIRYAAGIDLVELIELAPGARSVPDLFEAYCRRMGPAPLHDFLMALSTAFARKWLVSE